MSMDLTSVERTILHVDLGKLFSGVLLGRRQPNFVTRVSFRRFMVMPTIEGVRSIGTQCIWKVLGLRISKNVSAPFPNQMN